MVSVKMVCASDLHLGHRQNHASWMTKGLSHYLCDDVLLAETDILFLAGDVFDTLLPGNSDQLEHIYNWIIELLNQCAKHNVILRVLEGTPSHDWKQSWRFEAFNTHLGSRVNLKYVRDLSIEHIEPLGISVLYVPDEYNDTTEKTLTQAKNLIRQQGLSKVDVAIMHGNFDYQLPPFVPAQKHSAEEYLALVNGPIFIGHHHTHSSLERILAQGSFDRGGHGQEEPKGFIKAHYTGSQAFDWEFVENKLAMQYVTVDCTDLSIAETLALLEERMKTVPDYSSVRIQAETTNPIFSNIETVTSRYPLVHWGRKLETDDSGYSNSINTESGVESLYVPITITKDNIVDLLIERARGSLPFDQIDKARSILEDILDGVR